MVAFTGGSVAASELCAGGGGSVFAISMPASLPPTVLPSGAGEGESARTGTRSTWPQPGHLTFLPATSSLTLRFLPHPSHDMGIMGYSPKEALPGRILAHCPSRGPQCKWQVGRS